MTHPPAGAIPLIALSATIDFLALVEGNAVGGVTLMRLARSRHRVPPRQTCPRAATDAARPPGPPD